MNKEKLLQKIFERVIDVSRIEAHLNDELTKYKDTLEVLERHNLQDLELFNKIRIDYHFLFAIKVEVSQEIESDYVTMIKDIIRLNALGEIL